MSTPHRRFAANVLASFAQFERELGRERTVSSQNHPRKTGRWAGGRVPYGLRPTPNTEGRGKILIRDDRAEPIVRELAERIIAGEAPTRIAADLRARGVPAPRVHNSARPDPAPSAWTHKSIKIVMTSQTLLGHKIEHRTGKVIRDNAGPVKFWPPMLTQEEFARIAQIIEDGYRPRRPNRPSHWLHGVVICGVCGPSCWTTVGPGYSAPLKQWRSSATSTGWHRPDSKLASDSLTNPVGGKCARPHSRCGTPGMCGVPRSVEVTWSAARFVPWSARRHAHVRGWRLLTAASVISATSLFSTVRGRSDRPRSSGVAT